MAVPFEEDVAVGEGAAYVAARDFEGIPRVWRTHDGTLMNAEASVAAVTLLGIGGRLATWRDGAIEIQDLATATILARLEAAPAPGRLAVSPSGRHVASAAGTAVTIWNLEAGRALTHLAVEYPFEAAAFDASETWVATANARWLQIWNVVTGVEAARFPLDTEWYGDPSTHPALRFSSNGRFVSLSNDYRHRFWLWQPDDLITQACSLLVQKLLTPEEWTRYLGSEPYQSTCGPRS
jgi:hypothetical protein